MKTTVEIADPLFHRAKTLAAEAGLSFRTLLEEGLRAAIEARQTNSAEPFRLRDGSFKGGRGLRPGLRWEELPALAYDDESPHLQPPAPSAHNSSPSAPERKASPIAKHPR